MHAYFCPSCGRACESTECLQPGRPSALWRLECPKCGCRVELGGETFLLAAFLVLFVSTAGLIDGYTVFNAIGMTLSGALAGLGVVRLLRQLWAWFRGRALRARARDL